MLKAVLWLIPLLLIADLLYVGYFWVLHADYYFPGAYEDAFQAAALGVLVGISLVVAFIIALRRYLRTRTTSTVR